MEQIRITIEALGAEGEVLDKRGVRIDRISDVDGMRNLSVSVAKKAIELVLDPEEVRWSDPGIKLVNRGD